MVMAWQNIEGHRIEDKLVDGMNIIVEDIAIKKDKVGTIEHNKIKLAVEGQKVTVTCFDTTLTVLVQASSCIILLYNPPV